jgi:hypothetical protein
MTQVLRGVIVAMGGTTQEVKDKIDDWLSKNPQRKKDVICVFKPEKSWTGDSWNGGILIHAKEPEEQFPVI